VEFMQHSSPPFLIEDASNVYRPLVNNSIFYYKSVRDGDDVDPNVMNRQPSHLADKSAAIFYPPKYNSDDVLEGNYYFKQIKS
jgi:endoglucanase